MEIFWFLDFGDIIAFDSSTCLPDTGFCQSFILTNRHADWNSVCPSNKDYFSDLYACMLLEVDFADLFYLLAMFVRVSLFLENGWWAWLWSAAWEKLGK
ncbi:hypothetical protein ACH5RR_016850 [Cinchona calisaya]|uniref:Uncharacterized protein n=1 Tax=Cinchona calisaya TaxID=153742 RepID=A0ABD2ZX60_9GENT